MFFESKKDSRNKSDCPVQNTVYSICREVWQLFCDPLQCRGKNSVRSLHHAQVDMTSSAASLFTIAANAFSVSARSAIVKITKATNSIR